MSDWGDETLTTERESKPRTRSWALVGLVVVTLCAFVVVIYFRSRHSIENHPAADLLMAGQAAMEEQQFDVALAEFQQAELKGELPISALFNCAQAALRLGKVALSEHYLRVLLGREPDHVGGNELLCAMLRVAGRNWELRPYALELMKKDVFSPGNLAAVTASSGDVAVRRGPADETELESFILQSATAGEEILARLSQVRHLLAQNQYEAAIPILQGIIDEDPQQLEAQALLGSLLLKNDKLQAFQAWYRNLPNPASHPELWMVRGNWAEIQGDRQGAARCYWEALRLHPDHHGATYRLSQMLTALDRSADAAKFAERATHLAEIQMAVAVGWTPPSNVQQLAERMERLGRPWESLGWSMAALGRDPNSNPWARERVERLRGRIASDTPLVMDSLNPATQIDLSSLPVPAWDSVKKTRDVDSQASGGNIAFVDSAIEAGVSFSYFNGADPNRAYVFEFSGGGVGVLDYDGDGWSDLYLTQGCPWPPLPSQQRYMDRLYRNLGSGRYEDVTDRAGLSSTRYGQGVSIGDIDNDGFPDLYVANIGLNQLYHNNGDGTFTDITTTSGIAGTLWTISTLIADLNSDTNPDLYDVTYLTGPNLFTEICLFNGRPIQCYPNQFPGEVDKLYQSSGDGHFRDVSEESGILAPDGKGMGVIAADFDGSHRLSLFISNDTTPNFFFVNQTRQPGGEILFSERALLSGLAYSESGTAASCMGIAAGDVNGDELLDLFVTNFRDEANNLFVQTQKNLFDDQIRQSRLYGPGFLLEGWGAQFMDVDLDGHQDLVVANGHLDDYPHSAGLKRMPTQVFFNTGRGEFKELPAQQLGPYFDKKYLGRAVARLDWNRDGRPDFCITHVDTPFSLLTNQTANAGHFLVVHLRGVQSARDAIGANVTVRASDQRWSQQLVAGDGFAATNERILIFGLGQTTQVSEIKITWPSGIQQLHPLQDVDCELLFIEGRQTPVRVFK